MVQLEVETDWDGRILRLMPQQDRSFIYSEPVYRCLKGWPKHFRVAVLTLVLTDMVLQEALNIYQQNLKIGQILVEQDKSNADWQRALSVSYNRVGEVLVAQGKLQEALEAYQQSLASFKRLAEQDKSNAGWPRDLIVSLYKVGTTTAKIGANDNVAQAKGFFERLLT
ncbi:MAG: tetratricopeptide repeat protein [Verrucomicrobia bacterium]|nr:tetratricopeptide repeat protein [Verrucomicrobiota bacterium]